jgi:hypothetical protein
LSFAAGSTQNITGTLTLTGAAGNLITLSRNGGSGLNQWNINVSDTSNVSYVAVSNSNASGSTIYATYSTNGGNNTNWSFACIWTGNTSNDWNVPGNWSTTQVPTSLDSAEIPFILNPLRRPVIGDGINPTAVSITDLTIGDNATLMVNRNSSLSLTGDLRIHDGATLTLNDNTLIIPGATLTLNGNLTIDNASTSKLNGLPGSTVRFNGNTTVNVSGPTGLCLQFGNVIINGSLTAPTPPPAPQLAYALNVSGNWTNNGTFNHNNGVVILNGDGMQDIRSGASGFNRLIIQNSRGLGTIDPLTHNWLDPVVSSAVRFLDALQAGELYIRFAGGTSGYNTTAMMKQIVFASGVTHTITGTLNIFGSKYYLIQLLSDTPGMQWNLSAPLNTVIENVFVRDSNSSSPITANNSFNRGNNTNWAFGEVYFTGTGNLNDVSNWASGYVPQLYDYVRINGNMTLNSVYSAGRVTIDSGMYFNLAGYSFTSTGGIINSGNLILLGDENISGAITHMSGSTITYNGTGTYNSLKVGNTYINLAFNGSGLWRLDQNVTVSGNFTNTNGNFDFNGKTLTVSGDFTNTGNFGGTVVFDDASHVTYIHGTTFSDLIVTTPGKELVIDAGATETITGNLTLTGAAGNPIILRSSTPGSQWNIDPQGARDVSYVQVSDSRNINGLAITPVNSINSGNNTNWNFGGGTNENTRTLIPGESELYRKGTMLPSLTVKPALPSLITFAPIPVALPAAAGVTMPMPIGAAMMPMPIGLSAIPLANLPVPVIPEAFKGVISEAVLVPPVSFAGVRAQAIIPMPVSFAGTGAISIMPVSLHTVLFSGALGSAGLPVALRPEAFAVTVSQANLVKPAEFNGIVPHANLLNPVAFHGVIPLSSLEESRVFSNVSATTMLPASLSFEKALAKELLPTITFEGVLSQEGFLPASSFTGAMSREGFLPALTFEGVLSREALMPGLTFEGVASREILLSGPVFEGVISQAGFLPARNFEGILSREILMPGLIFEGATAAGITPRPVSEELFTIKGGSLLPQAISRTAFEGVVPRALSPENIFTGIGSQELMPTRTSFEGIQAQKSLLPNVSFDKALPAASLESPKPKMKINFEMLPRDLNTKVVFPGGQPMMPAYNLGVPLGAEKPLMEPRIQKDEDE